MELILPIKSRHARANKRAFTLVELSIVMAAAGAMSMVDIENKKFDDVQALGSALGSEISNYNGAVGQYLARYSGDPSEIGVSQSSTKTFKGSDWLKHTSCGGDSDLGYLGCTEFINDKSLTLGSIPTTVISITDDGSLKARTVWSPFTTRLDEGNSTAMGVAALAASGHYVATSAESAVGYQEPTVFCPDVDAYSIGMTDICQDDKGRIVSTSRSTPVTDVWLRTDHGNTMNHVIEFDNGSGKPSSLADLEDIDDKSVRQIINVSRLYNLGPSGSDSIIIGKSNGRDIYTDSYLSGNDLLKNAIISDGDQAVMNDLYVKGRLFVNNNAEFSRDVQIGRDLDVKGDIKTEGEIKADGNIRTDKSVYAEDNVYASNNIYADRDIKADRDLIAGRNVNASENVTAGDDVEAGYALRGKHLKVTDTMEALVWYDTTYGKESFGNGGYEVNPSHSTRMNKVTLEGRLNIEEYLQINRVSTLHSACSLTGLVSRDSKGQMLTCQSGRWMPAYDSVPVGLYAYVASSSCPDGWVKANGGNGTVDLRGRFIRTWDDGKGIDKSRSIRSSQSSAIPNLKGEVQGSVEESQSYANGVFTLMKNKTKGAPTGNYSWGFSMDASNYSNVYKDNVDEVRPDNIAMLACMKKE